VEVAVVQTVVAEEAALLEPFAPVVEAVEHREPFVLVVEEVAVEQIVVVEEGGLAVSLAAVVVVGEQVDVLAEEEVAD